MTNRSLRVRISILGAAVGVILCYGVNYAIPVTSSWLAFLLSVIFFACVAGLVVTLLQLRVATREASSESALKRILETLKQDVRFNGESGLSLSTSYQVRTDQGSSIEQLTTDQILSRFNLQVPPDLMLLGEAGSGKSSLMVRMAVAIVEKRYQNQAGYIPLLLSARSWAPGAKMEEWVVREACQRYLINPDLTSAWIRSGSVLLLLDGVDEIAPAATEQVLDGITRWKGPATDNRIFVSCRQGASLDKILTPSFSTVAYLQDLSPETLSGLIARVVPRGKEIERIRVPSAVDPRNWTKPRLANLIVASATGLDDDKAAAASILIGDESIHKADLPAARRAYEMAVESSTSSYSRAVSLTRLGLLLDAEGDTKTAGKVLGEAVRIDDDIADSHVDRSAAQILSRTEIAVMNSLTADVGYGLPEIAGRSALPLSSTREALRKLGESGFVQSDDMATGTRFRAAVLVISNSLPDG